LSISSFQKKIDRAAVVQVIQEKTSSKKFACAVCGEKQSVTSVCARSSVAKEVRLAVQVSDLILKDLFVSFL
jgi:transcription elongation factor Elf1